MASMDLGKQMGPLPLGAWIAVVAGGLGIAVWQRKNSAANTPVPVEDTSGVPGVGTGGSGQWTQLPTPGAASGTGGSPVYDSNEAWSQAAIQFLIGQGYQPGISNSAITKALAGGSDIDGNKMSVQEWALWSIALTKLGPPPYPVNVSPPVSVPTPVTPTPTPVTPTPVTPKPPSTGGGNTTPRYHVYVAQHGDTLGGIAKKYGTSWQTIYNFNLKYRSPATAAIIRARGPNLFYAGSTWWIPY